MITNKLVHVPSPAEEQNVARSRWRRLPIRQLQTAIERIRHALAGNFNCTCAAGSASWHAQLATADDSSLHAQPALPAAIARANQHQVEISASDGDDLLAGCDHAIIRRREPHAIVLNRIPARVMCEASG